MCSPDTIGEKYRLLAPHLRIHQRSLWAAAEAATLGRGGIKLVSAATGITCSTISRALSELRGLVPDRPRKTPMKGGQRLVEEKDPRILDALEALVADETAGSPMSEKKWQRSSLRKLGARLGELGRPVNYCTVARLLRKLGYSLRANKKRRSGAQCPGRDEQFRHIASQRASFGSRGLPIISVDTKKKELIGNFRNNGRAWRREPEEVNDHDFTSTAEYRAVPFGIYDVGRNEGLVVVGISNDTPEFAVNAIARWWVDVGLDEYPSADELLILADCGGTNGHRHRAWKWNIRARLCDRFGLTVTVGHYPPGCSKWNPIEHRLFSQISINWAGKPLRSLELMLGYIRGTSTSSGLKVRACLDEAFYRKGEKVAWAEIDRLAIESHGEYPDWNYTIRPGDERLPDLTDLPGA